MDESRQLLTEIAGRIKQVREELDYSPERMAKLFGITRSGYIKYEAGDSCPRPLGLAFLARTFDISLDWLISGKGPMYYREKMQTEEKSELEPVMQDVKELLDYMERVPLLRYQVLTSFHQFKLDHKELVESSEKTPEAAEEE